MFKYLAVCQLIWLIGSAGVLAASHGGKSSENGNKNGHNSGQNGKDSGQDEQNGSSECSVSTDAFGGGWKAGSADPCQSCSAVSSITVVTNNPSQNVLWTSPQLCSCAGLNGETASVNPTFCTDNAASAYCTITNQINSCATVQFSTCCVAAGAPNPVPAAVSTTTNIAPIVPISSYR